jgi:hypothetical protein
LSGLGEKLNIRDNARTSRKVVFLFAGDPPPSDQVDASVVTPSYTRERH